MEPRPFRRVLLKLSGELLAGPSGQGIDPEAVFRVAERVGEIRGCGVQAGIVVGAGNLFRGLGASRGGMDRCNADAIGMLATVMNALALREALEAGGSPAEVQSAVPMTGIAAPFDHRRARESLDAGTIVLFAAGTGHPFFTTDTTAALRACQVQADVVLKGTKVDGVYTADPLRDPSAKRYSELTFDQALAQKLEVMDTTAFSLCRENRLPIVVFRFGTPGDLKRIVRGDLRTATLVHAGDRDRT
ncbi:MAG: UMP kinase [Lentisphaeria bacterium]|nr:UMP kinase [Lentisphaeria bacterium]